MDTVSRTKGADAPPPRGCATFARLNARLASFQLKPRCPGAPRIFEECDGAPGGPLATAGCAPVVAPRPLEVHPAPQTVGPRRPTFPVEGVVAVVGGAASQHPPIHIGLIHS